MAETVTDRRIGPIRDLARNQNWKQALKECEKWQRKGEKSDKFLALKAFVLANQLDQGQKKKGEAETLQLCHRTPAVTDLEAIDDLQYALKHLSLQQEEGIRIWERAAATSTKDKNLLTAWLNTSVGDGNWRSAQKAATALRNAFPKERQYEFWNILMCFLVFKDRSTPEKEQTMFGTLAFRMIKKAAEAVPERGADALASGKSILTFDELELLVQIYTAMGNSSDALDLLRGDKLGTTSQVFQQDPGEGYQLLASLLTSAKDWRQAFDTCESIIEKPEMLDHDALWEAYFELQKNFDTFPVAERLPPKALMEAKTRAAYKTYLRIMKDRGQFENLFTASTWYFTENIMKSYCFEDLSEGGLQALDEQHTSVWRRFIEEQLVQHEQSDHLDSMRLFQLKYDRSKPENTETAPVLLARAERSLNVALPEATLLGAMDLMRAAALTGQPEQTMRAALLLEIGKSSDPSYYSFSLLLVVCYLSLGLISLALETFVSLSVKNLQWESVGWLLLSRISTLHPHQTGSGEDSLNPSGALEAALRTQQKTLADLNDGLFKGLRNGAYRNVIDSVTLMSELKRSLNSHNYKLEERRIKRLLSPLSLETVLDASAEVYSDKRDLKMMPHGTIEDLKAYNSLAPNPPPGVFWANAMSAADHVTSYFKFSIDNRPDLADLALQRYEHALRLGRQASEHPCRELSHIENSMWQCIQRMETVIKAVLKDSQPAENEEAMHWFNAELQEMVEKSDERHRGDVTASAGRVHRVSGTAIPAWEFLHTSYTQLEICGVFFCFLHWIRHRIKLREKETKKKGLWDKSVEQINQFDALISAIEAKVKEGAKQIKQGINEGGVLGKLVDVVLAREEGRERNEWTTSIGKLADEATVETIVGRWKDSWNDALEGVGMVKTVPSKKK